MDGRCIKDIEKKNKKLIIVYDNIDRLQEIKVKEVWSSIHTFFSESEYENIMVIIPFSKNHILNAFGKENEGIIEKTFSVIYNVTPLVLVDWKGYFDENLKTIFVNVSDDEKNIIRNLYNKNIEKITPRGVKKFINELKVLNSIYTDIELKYTALFLLIKDNIQENFPNYFYGEEFQKYKRILGNDTDEKIIALYFGIEKSEAVQVLLEREMIKALEEGNFSIVDNMSQITGFNEVLEKVIIDLSREGKTDKIYKEILIALKNININFGIIKFIFNSFMKEEKYFSFQEYHKILLEKYNQKEEEILKKLLKINFYNKDDENNNISSLCNQLKELEKYMKDRNYNFNEYIESKTYEPIVFFKMLDEFKDSYERYKINFEKNETEKYLIDNIRSFSKNEIENLDILMKKFDFAELKRELILRVQKDRENVVNENEYKIFTDFLIKENKDLSELEKEFDMEALFNKMKNFENSNYNKEKSKEKKYILSLMLAIVSINPNKINYIPNYILDSITQEELKEIIEILLNYVEIDRLFIMLSNYSNKNLIINIVRTIIENKNIKYLNLENIIRNYNRIRSLISSNLKKEFFNMIDTFYKNNLNFDYKNIAIELNLNYLMLDSQNYDLNFVEYLKKLYIHYFNEEESTGYLYKECYDQNHKLLDILNIVIESSELKLNNSLINDFNKVLLEIIKGNIKLSEKNENILIKIGKKISQKKIENTININVKDEILKKNYLEYEKCKFFYDIFIKTKFFYFDKNEKDNPSKREDYNRLIKIIIEPYLDYKECQNFIIDCTEFRKGLEILKEYNEEFIIKAEKFFQKDEKMKKFFNELKCKEKL